MRQIRLNPAKENPPQERLITDKYFAHNTACPRPNASGWRTYTYYTIRRRLVLRTSASTLSLPLLHSALVRRLYRSESSIDAFTASSDKIISVIPATAALYCESAFYANNGATFLFGLALVRSEQKSRDAETTDQEENSFW
jgi:hypothetical protein